MAVNLIPYLSFDNRAREAMEFYRSVFGGQLDVTEFGAYGTPSSPDDAGKVMHSALVTAAGPTIFAADTGAQYGAPPSASSISLALTGGPDDEPTLRGYFDALAAGGTVTVPLDVAPWGDTFGMLTDRFGTEWMVSVAATSA
jgi:PhnB protein